MTEKKATKQEIKNQLDNLEEHFEELENYADTIVEDIKDLALKTTSLRKVQLITIAGMIWILLVQCVILL